MTVICHDDSFISVTNVLLEPISATIGREVGYTLVRLSLYPPCQFAVNSPPANTLLVVKIFLFQIYELLVEL